MTEGAKGQIKKYLGLCSASRSTVCGGDTVVSAVRKNPKKVFLVLCAADASERTKKQVSDKCAYYDVAQYNSDFTMDELSDALGKKSLVSAVALTNRGLAEEIKKLLNDNHS